MTAHTVLPSIMQGQSLHGTDADRTDVPNVYHDLHSQMIIQHSAHECAPARSVDQSSLTLKEKLYLNKIE